MKIKDITLIGMMVAVIEVCKVALLGLPNIELTTFWIIMFTLYFGKNIIYVIPVFILIEGCIYGCGLWWIMYLYMWPSLVFVTWLVRKQKNMLLWCILSSIYGFLFGLFCAIPYVVIGISNGGIRSGLIAGFSWWVAGIPWDIAHGIGNFVLMLILFYPIHYVMKKTKMMMRIE